MAYPSADPPEKILELVKEYVDGSNSQRAAARGIQVSQPTINNWYHGRTSPNRWQVQALKRIVANRRKLNR